VAAQRSPHDILQNDPQRFWDLNHFKPEDVAIWPVDLKALGCSDPHGMHDYSELISFGDVKVVPPFSWISTFGSQLLFPPILLDLLAAIVLALAVYVLLRAIGWVIGGFAAS
jgi:hypothetical protein